MINLITGGPGSGKTNKTLSMILKEINEGQRPLYVHGIPDLKVFHIEIKCSSRMCEHCKTLTDGDYIPAESMHQHLPQNALVVIDEAQHIYRPRNSASAVPDNVAFLETHRHTGLDLYVITQSPKLIDVNVRELVTRHIHNLVYFGGRKSYEWPECQDNPKSGRADAIKTHYMLDKGVYGLYRSATQHTKQDRRLPKFVYLLPVLLLLMIPGIMRLKAAISGDVVGQEAVGAGEGVAQDATATVPVADVPPASTVLQPRDFYRLETAPAYDDLVQAQTFPVLSACIASETRCKCYTQQGTEYPTTLMQCRDFVEGRTFVPYLSSARP